QMLAAGQYVLLGATMTSVLSAVSNVAQARAAADRIAEVLAETPAAYGPNRLPPGGGRLEFRGVAVRRGEDAAILDLDFDVSAGSCVAIVGRSGAGKSLLAALAGRLIDPDAGEVRLDGIDLRQLEHDELRSA